MVNTILGRMTDLSSRPGAETIRLVSHPRNAFLVCAVAFMGVGGVDAQEAAPRSAVVQRINAAPDIDGQLDEQVWRSAASMTDFIQREPDDGALASERTEVRLLYDQEAIYVGVWAYDSRAEQIVPGEAIRDFEVTDADAVIMVFDTFKDEQNGFVFGTTPAGIEYDGQVASAGSGGGFFLGGGSNNQRRFQAGAGGGFNKNWDGSWDVAATSQLPSQFLLNPPPAPA